MVLADEREQRRAVLGVTEAVDDDSDRETKSSENTLTLYDAAGKILWQAPPKKEAPK